MNIYYTHMLELSSYCNVYAEDKKIYTYVCFLPHYFRKDSVQE